ncbi:hypothetical protein QR680_012902 [Steinernema hermaphroditum]|uniref:USP domain-containing protein n=1 Tax=Steinernema hermaphroditum TaxID=289476 RepID=A0AA39I3P5_9BILA|nr:hypothetical protein QR680_012902 [Steinernema hermaphroditum]
MDYADQLSNGTVPEGSFGLLYSFAHTDNVGTRAVTSLAFDPYEELLWIGNNGGYVVSHYPPSTTKYTSFKTNHNVTRAFSFTENAVISLSKAGIHGNRRAGVPLFTYTSSHLTNLHCIHPIPNAPQTVIVGGYQQKIVQFDVEQQKEQRVILVKQKNCTGIRSNDKFIFSSDTEGRITLRNMNTVDSIAAIDAHEGFISDFDIYGNQLVTCGYSNRLNRFTADLCVKIFDLRTLRLEKSVQLTFCPFFCRFVPTEDCTKILAVSQSGEMEVINNAHRTAADGPIQLDVYSVSAISVSQSKQCFAIGEESGLIHIFSDREQPIFHVNPNITEFPEPDELSTHIPIMDTMTPLSIVNMPVTEQPLLSDWPTAMSERVYREPDVINDRTYETLRMADFIGYCRNPRANTPLAGYNVLPYSTVVHQQMVRTMQNQDQQSQLTRHPNNDGETNVTPTKGMDIPKCYQNQNKLVRSGQWTNKTELILISDNDSGMFYVNPILTALYHVLPVRNVFLQHLCFNEHCLTCQIGFLYRVLSDKKPNFNSFVPALRQSYLASSSLFVQSLKTLEEANTFDQVEQHNEEDDDLKIREKTQKFLHFLLGYLQKEQEVDTENGETIGDFVKMEYEENCRCLSCFADSSISSSKSSSHVLTLTYPQRQHDKMTPLSFCHLVEHSILRKDQASHKCEKCDKHAQKSSTRRVRSLPPVLLIDTDISSQAAQSFWTFQLKHSERKPTANHPFGVYESRSPARKPCRYGNECRTINCRYSHPSNDNMLLDVASGSSSLRMTQSLPDLREWSHYLAPSIYVSCTREGLCSVSETATGEANTVVYHLASAVMAIGTPAKDSAAVPSYLVSEVCIGPRNNPPNGHVKNWVVVNDETAAKVDEHTALHLDMRWKQPVILLYVQSEHPAVKNVIETRKAIPKEVFWHGMNLAAGSNAEVAKINTDNIPKAGDIVGMDAEFVVLGNAKKTQQAGRVSCIDAKGRILIDDYIRIPSCDVHDYLTQFSGIVEGDLNPLTTTRYLTTQKYTYMKILYLIEQKVVFVGHGLDNDFGVLKLFAPPTQVRDTVHMFYLLNHKMLPLRFLAYHFFQEKIQEKEHCSVEDARMALRLYTLYEELKGSGKLDETLQKLYSAKAKTDAKGAGESQTPPPPDSAEENCLVER